MNSIRHLAAVLGGDVAGRDRLLVPGPGHSRADRSLSVILDAADPLGFRVHSFAGDDWRACRDYVRERLGLGDSERVKSPRSFQSRLEDHDRTERAFAIWHEARPIMG